MSSPQATVLADLSNHLLKVQEEPTIPLDIHLLEQCELYTATPEYRTRIWRDTQALFVQMALLLPDLQQDPSPLTNFIKKLAEPYSFDDVKDLSFLPGLNPVAKFFHELVLFLLNKAAVTANDAEKLANKPEVVQAIVRLWLCSDDTGTSSKAAALLISLLSVSKDLPSDLSPAGVSLYGRGPMWKRLFDDKDIYNLFYFFCSNKAVTVENESPLSKRDKTIAQARLMDWLPKVGALDWDTITMSHNGEVEKQVGLKDGEGLLHFAALKMVDVEDDILMYISAVNFFSDLLATVKTTSPSNNEASVSLDWLRHYSVHAKTLDITLTDTPSMESSFLASPAANYISVWASIYPDHFEHSAEMPTIRQKLTQTIHSCKPEDLHIISSFPRSSIIPSTSTALDWSSSPLLSIPASKTSPDALKTLATIFHGPIDEEITFPPPSPAQIHATSQRLEIEKTWARALTSFYIVKNSSFFEDVTRHAETIAMKENALAALILLRALITANWSAGPIPHTAADSDPILLRLGEFPKTGVELILEPTISGPVIPFLLKPATTFSGLVGGRGDAESAAYQVANAKFDVLRVLEGRVSKLGGKEDLVRILRQRIGEGVWGSGGGVGSRIGTLEL